MECGDREGERGKQQACIFTLHRHTSSPHPRPISVHYKAPNTIGLWSTFLISTSKTMLNIDFNHYVYRSIEGPVELVLVSTSGRIGAALKAGGEVKHMSKLLERSEEELAGGGGGDGR